MQLSLTIAIWNANGISNHTQELSIFLNTHFIDICLISETHFTPRSYFKVRGYDLIATNHPDNRAHAGAAVLIKSTIKYDVLEEYKTNCIQAAGVKIKCKYEDIPIYAIYSPPRHSINCQEYHDFFQSLGPRFIVGGDYNAKHPWWASRLINPKGRELYKCIRKYHYSVLSTGNPTYWPSDPRKTPDLLDFVVFNGISNRSLGIIDSNELSSDHTPIILTYNTSLESIKKSINLLTPKTDLESFGHWINRNIDLATPIESSDDLDNAVENFTSLIHEAAFLSTPIEAISGRRC